jgi:hypothetical protein
LLFEEPIYGVLGGFHYPVDEGRNITWQYKYFVVDKLPWEKLTIDDVNKNIELLSSNFKSCETFSILPTQPLSPF